MALAKHWSSFNEAIGGTPPNMPLKLTAAGLGQTDRLRALESW
jgi:hypothetical protein